MLYSYLPMPPTGRTNMPDDAIALEVVGKRNKILLCDPNHFCHLGGGDIWIFLNHPNNFQCSTGKCNWCRFGDAFGDVFGDVSSRNRNQNASRIGFKDRYVSFRKSSRQVCLYSTVCVSIVRGRIQLYCNRF